MVESIIFWIFAVVSVTAALGAVLNRSIIYAALCLIAVFLSIAGFFVLNNADFLAIAQIIIYAVGLTIIMLFAIMFTGDKPPMVQKANRVAKIISGIILFYFAALMLRAFLLPVAPATIPNRQLAQIFAEEGSTNLLGTLLFRTYALPFELASVLLLAAMIGAIVIAKKRFSESDAELLGETRFPLDSSSHAPEAVIAALREKRLGGSTSDRRLNPKSEIGEMPETEPEMTAGRSTNENAGS